MSMLPAYKTHEVNWSFTSPAHPSMLRAFCQPLFLSETGCWKPIPKNCRFSAFYDTFHCGHQNLTNGRVRKMFLSVCFLLWLMSGLGLVQTPGFPRDLGCKCQRLYFCCLEKPKLRSLMSPWEFKEPPLLVSLCSGNCTHVRSYH
jgi:hypothetical protein